MKIAIIGNPGYVKKTFLKTTDSIFKEVGLNTGNLAFWYAVSSHIENKKEYFGWDFDPTYINNNFDRVVFIAANQLNPAWNMKMLADKFKLIKIPLIVIGIGVQSSFNDDVFKQQEGTIEFMEVMSQKSKHISVRGELTKKVFEKYGITNIKVTGCPSNFINPNNAIAKSSNPKNFLNKNINNIVFNIDIVDRLKNFLPLSINWIKGLDNFIFVSQAPLNIVELARIKNPIEKINLLNTINNLLFSGAATMKYTNYFVKKYFKVFFNAESWMEELLKYDFSIGTRMHGNMLAFQVGIPTIFTAHDKRVLEMFNTMKLPYIMLEDVFRYKNINQIIKHANYSEENYINQRKKLCKEYISILEENDILINKNLKKIISN